MLPIYIRTTPIILLFILAMTVVPAGFRMPSAASTALGFEPWGFTANTLLFFPLGLALGRSGIWHAARWGATLSIAVELAQLFLEDRHSTLADFVANTLGALCGAAVSRWLGLLFGWRFDRFRLGRRAAFGAVLPLLAFGVVFHQRASLWSWDPSYKLAVGDELTGDRPWQGDIFEIAIFNVPLNPAIFPLLASEGPGSIGRNRQLFPAAPVFERTTPLDLAKLHGKPLLEGQDARRFFDSLVDAENFTVLVWCRPAKSSQAGPARIVTYSLDSGARNFTLAQEYRRVSLRVRTLMSDPNALVFATRTGAAFRENEDVLLAAGYDGRFSRIYVDGDLAREEDLANPGLFWFACSVEFVPGVLVQLGALLAIAVLGLARLRDHRPRWFFAGIAGCVAAIVYLVAGGGDIHPLLGPFAALFGPLGAFAVPWGIVLNSDSAGTSRNSAPSGENA